MAKAPKTAAAAKPAASENGGKLPNTPPEAAENKIENQEEGPAQLLARAEAAEGQLAQLAEFLAGDPDGYRALDGETDVQTAIRIIVNQGQTIASLLPEAKAPPAPDLAPERAAFEALAGGEVATFADLPEDAPLVLVFTDTEAVLDIPRRDVAPHELSRSGGRAVLDAKLSFDSSGPLHSLTTIWLVSLADPEEGDCPAVRCEIPGHLPVGGGRVASIPSGHLIF